jgi:hypothetical protein
MKTLVIYAFSFIACTFAIGQDLPKKEFQPSLSENTLAIAPGETKELTVAILRSKAWTKSEATLSIPAKLPAGVTITFEPPTGHFQESRMKVVIDDDAKPGVHTILVRSELRHTKKGNLLRLEIGDQSIATGVDN